MLRLQAFRPTQDKVVKLLLHPTYPWLVTFNDDDVRIWQAWMSRSAAGELKATTLVASLLEQGNFTNTAAGTLK
jgi:hypothetical protein